MKIQANHKILNDEVMAKDVLKAIDGKSITLVIMPHKPEQCAVTLQFKNQAELDSFKAAL